MSLSAMILPEWDTEMATSRKLLALIPDGRFDYKPHEKSMTMGQLANHLADMAGWAKETMTLERLELDAGFRPEVAATNAALMEKFDRCAAAGRAAIAAAADDAYAVRWTMVYAGREVMSNPRGVVLRGMIINHHIHHRGQLAVYLRLLNIPLPGIYGPSADTPSGM